MKKPHLGLAVLFVFLLTLYFPAYSQIGIDEDVMKEGKALLSKENEIRKEILGENLFGIYFGSKYIGLTSTKISEGMYEGKRAYQIEKALEAQMGITTFSMKKTIYTLPDFSPLYIEFKEEQVMFGETTKETIRLWIKDGKLIIEEDKNGDITNRTLPFEKGIIPLTIVEDIIYRLADLNIPKKYGFDVLNPENGEIGTAYLKVNEKEEITIKDKTLTTYKLIMTSPDGESLSFWIDENKKIIKIGMEKVPIAMIAITKEEIGKDLTAKRVIPLEQRSPSQVVVDFFFALNNQDEGLMRSSIAFETMCGVITEKGEFSNDEKKSICKVFITLTMEELRSGKITSEALGFSIDLINEELFSEEITDDKAMVSFKGEGTPLLELIREQGAWKIFPEELEVAGWYYKQGNAAYNSGDYDGAIGFYSMAIRLRPESEEAYYDRGAAYYYKGLYDEAVKDYDKSIELNPENANAYSNRGHIYFRKGDYGKAISDHNKTIELAPLSVIPYSNLGYIYFDLKQYNDAVKNFQKAIKLDDKYADAYSGLGITYFKLGKIELAKKNYKKAIKLDARYNGKIEELEKEGYFYTKPQLDAINALLKKLKGKK